MEYSNIVITGASAGIGAALARRFARDKGKRLILLARRQDKLETLRQDLGNEVEIFELDVTSPGSVEKVFKTIEEQFGAIEVLVNNAGGAFGLDMAQYAALEDWERCIDVNIKGLMYCTHAVLKGMVRQKRGHIINLGSTAGRYPYPGGNAYCGAKAFVHQFSLSLRADLLGTGVRVTCIEPGLTGGTEFSAVRFRGDKAKTRAVYQNTQPLLPEDIAEVIYYCTTLPTHVNINTIELMPVSQAFSALSVYRTDGEG